MNDFISRIFGKTVGESEYRFPTGTPLFITRGYSVKYLTFVNTGALLVRPVDQSVGLKAVKKQIPIIESTTGLNVILEMDKLTAWQRTCLIEAGIAFVSGTGQVFIPFWGSYFECKIREKAYETKVLTSAAQFVFLYLYYNDTKAFGVTQISIAKELKISKATCSRAIQCLLSLRLISVSEEGTATLIRLNGTKSEALNNAIGHMIDPLKKKIYVNTLPDNIEYNLSGILALSKRSALAAKPGDEGFAISKSNQRLIDKNSVVDADRFRDLGGFVIEVWNYDPSVLTTTDCVDDISLLMRLRRSSDERVQNELDVIRREHGLIKENYKQ